MEASMSCLWNLVSKSGKKCSDICGQRSRSSCSTCLHMMWKLQSIHILVCRYRVRGLRRSSGFVFVSDDLVPGSCSAVRCLLLPGEACSPQKPALQHSTRELTVPCHRHAQRPHPDAPCAIAPADKLSCTLAYPKGCRPLVGPT